MNYYNTEIGEENENKIQTFIQTLIKGFSTRELQKSGESDEYLKALPCVCLLQGEMWHVVFDPEFIVF